MKPYRDFFKRVFDIAVSGSALIILALPLGIVTLWLFIANKGAGAFFFQERPGKNGKIFKICKFKTMTDEKDAAGNLLPDANRITKLGRSFVQLLLTNCHSCGTFSKEKCHSSDLVHCLFNIFLYIQKSKLVATKYVQASPVGRNATAVTPSHGKKNLSLTCGMSTTSLSSPTAK